LHPHPSLAHPISSFFFSPLPNSPQRSQQPCLQDPVLSSPLCPDLDLGDSPLPAPGPGLRAVGEVPVFNQHKPQRGAARGAAGPTQVSGRAPAPAPLPSHGTPRGTHNPADSALVHGRSGPAPPPQGQKSNNVQGQAGGLWKPRGWGFGDPSCRWGMICPVGHEGGPGDGHCLLALPSSAPPSCSPDPVDEAGGTFGDGPPCCPILCLTRACFRSAFTPAGPPAGPSPCQEWGQGAASSAVTHLAPRQCWAPWTGVEEGMGVGGVSGTYGGGGL